MINEKYKQQLDDFNIREWTVIFDEKNNISWFDRIAAGEIYKIKVFGVGKIVKELKEDFWLI